MLPQESFEPSLLNAFRLKKIEPIVFSLFLMMKDLIHTSEAQGKQSERLLI